MISSNLQCLFSKIEIANNELGASIGLEDDNNMFLWNVIFEGPSDTLYEVSLLYYNQNGRSEELDMV